MLESRELQLEGDPSFFHFQALSPQDPPNVDIQTKTGFQTTLGLKREQNIMKEIWETTSITSV